MKGRKKDDNRKFVNEAMVGNFAMSSQKNLIVKEISFGGRKALNFLIASFDDLLNKKCSFFSSLLMER